MNKDEELIRFGLFYSLTYCTINFIILIIARPPKPCSSCESLEKRERRRGNWKLFE